jgi:hypothetical protein
MAPHVSSATAMSPEAGPEQLPISSWRASAESSTVMQRHRPRPLEAAQCSLCGIALPLGLLVPDGGRACADIRWYCKDAKSCTERWTTALLSRRAQMPMIPGSASVGAGMPVTGGASAERLDGESEEAESVNLRGLGLQLVAEPGPV